jgi:hypothetical protein
MAVGFPVKDDYATGDVLTAANMNDFAGTLNTVPDVVGGFAAGKNKIINGDFRINQRAFTSTTSTAIFTFDRWRTTAVGDGTATFTAQTFTPGTAPVAGYEGSNYSRIVTTGQSAAGTFTDIRQSIESVRTLAGQTATVSFWAKANSGTPKVAVEFQQFFASGGSGNVQIYAGQVTLSTSWARYSLTLAIPSISGKTIGTGSDGGLTLELVVSAGSDFNARTGSLGIQSNTFEFWGVQLEAGNQMTPFQTATGTIQGELAAAQRYYWRNTNTGSGAQNYTQGLSISTSAVYFGVQFPVTMRATPSSIDYSAVSVSSASTGYTGGTTAAVANQSSPSAATLSYTHTSAALTNDRSYLVQIGASTGYIAFNAEL